MNEGQALPGVLAGVGPARRSDLEAFAAARLRLVRLRARVNPVADLIRWREAGASEAILQLLSPLPARHPMSPQAFVESFASPIAGFLALGGRYLEIHDEPNRPDRGAGVSWQDGAGFGVWFGEVVQRIRDQFGTAPQVGFPALAPSGLPRPDPSAPIDEGTFLEQCRDALSAADWAALHIYWRTPEEMRGFGVGMRFLTTYLEAFPGQLFAITEFANVSTDVAPEVRGDQIAEFLTTMAQYDRVIGATGFLLRSTEGRYDPLAWLAAEGAPRGILARVGRRPVLPDPHRLRLTWPTASREVARLFGVAQRSYYDCCHIAGGHNGLDLRVDQGAPGASPIFAALRGTVVQVAHDESGYGRHVRVRSYGPHGEEITLLYAHLSRIEVKSGSLIAGGDVLGRAGVAGSGRPPHLHFGMRVAGVSVPVLRDWVNPRPYLEALG